MAQRRNYISFGTTQEEKLIQKFQEDLKAAQAEFKKHSFKVWYSTKTQKQLLEQIQKYLLDANEEKVEYILQQLKQKSQPQTEPLQEPEQEEVNLVDKNFNDLFDIGEPASKIEL